MIVAKIIGAGWMVLTLFLWFGIYIKGINPARLDQFNGFKIVLIFWLITGFAPIAVAKFVWAFIS